MKRTNCPEKIAYYKTVDMLLKRKKKPHFVFASPNIPNPEVYLKLLTDIETDGDDSHLCSTFSPVAQIKFSIDLNNFTVSVTTIPVSWITLRKLKTETLLWFRSF